MSFYIVIGSILLVYAFAITYFLGRKHNKKEKINPAQKPKIQQNSNANKVLSNVLNGLNKMCNQCPGGDCDHCVCRQVMTIIEKEVNHE